MLSVVITLAAATRLAGQAATPAPEHEPGIYMDASGGGASLVKLRCNRAQEVKTKGIMKSMVSQGFIKPSFAAELTGGMADIRLPEGDLSFDFYFGKGSAPDPSKDLMAAMGNSMSGDVMPADATNADDFVLIQLSPKEHAREAALGEVTNSAKSKAAIDRTTERVAQGVYRLKPKSPLKPGEYAFYYATKMAGGPSMSLWDFGIDAKK
jgi:hypothetical protein